MERLGLGPDDCFADNARLVYGRMTGWGQDGPLAKTAGHDINYIALSGALHAIGREGQAPVPPLNLVGDYGGGATYLALGVVAALFEARQSGQGQVVDASMVEGSASLMTGTFGMRAANLWQDRRGVNIIDSGAPYYDTYETKDGRWIAVGAIEPKFYAALLGLMGLGDEEVAAQNDRARWPDLKRRFAEVFRAKTRDEWCEIMEGSDACFAPVLSLDEVSEHPHNRARASFTERDGIVQPGPDDRASPFFAEEIPCQLHELNWNSAVGLYRSRPDASPNRPAAPCWCSSARRSCWARRRTARRAKASTFSP